MKDKKIFFLNGAYDGCYYYRGYMPGVYSGQYVVGDFIAKQFDMEDIVTKAKDADIVVIQRPHEPRRAEIAKILKKMGKKIIFENDDSYLPDKGIPMHLLQNDKQRDIAREMSRHLNETLSICDGAVASTEFLANEYREINKNTIVLKNCIDPLDEYQCTKNDTGKFRIGFIGSVSTNDDYLHIKDQIKRLDDHGGFTIVVFGVKFKDGSILTACDDDRDFWESLKNIEWQPFVPVSDYYYTISRLALDLAVIPRKEHYFNQCKSNLKFLEMSLLHIPVIAQGFGDGTSPYQGIDEEYMTVIVDNDTWYDRIIDIKENYDTYKLLAEKAHDYVITNYNIVNYAQTWYDEIIKLCKFQQTY